MNRFKYLKISNTKNIRYLSNYYKKNLYIVFLHGFMSDIEGEKPKAFFKYARKKKYGFLEQKKPFERTYRRASNLDDIYENGIHDYLKFVKFGYGRATDHACKDIRAKIMSRKKAIKEIKKRDHIKSKDLKIWLKYVGWNEKKFDDVANTFRDPRVWWIKDGKWTKNNIWGNMQKYQNIKISKI